VPVPVVKIRHLTAEPQLHGYHDAITDPAGKSFSSRRETTPGWRRLECCRQACRPACRK
jgi:hypothetical protein